MTNARPATLLRRTMAVVLAIEFSTASAPSLSRKRFACPFYRRERTSDRGTTIFSLEVREQRYFDISRMRCSAWNIWKLVRCVSWILKPYLRNYFWTISIIIFLFSTLSSRTLSIPYSCRNIEVIINLILHKVFLRNHNNPCVREK